MSELPEGLTQAELDEYAKLDRGIKKLQVRHGELNAKIKTSFTQPGTFIFGSVVVKRGEADSFAAKEAEIEYPVVAYPEYYKSVFDRTKMPEDEQKKFLSKTPRLSVDVVA